MSTPPTKNLPDAFVQEHLAKAKGMTFFGHRFEDLTRDELIAAAVVGFESYTRAVESAERSQSMRTFLAEARW